jgi:hypothetical protein
MIRDATLRLTPKIFPALTGLTLAEFERLAEGFAAAHARERAASTHTKKGTPRRRAAGAGAGRPARDGAVLAAGLPHV